MKPAPHRPSDPFLGVTVLDDYRIVSHVRSEPRGETYRALPLHTGRPVLVKLVAQGLPRDISGRATWAHVWSLAERLPRIDHPNVERVLDCALVHVDGAERFCVVTEQLEGESLQHHVRARGHLTVDEVLTTAQQIAQGLAAAHRLGVVHGDLRGTNVTLVGQASNDGADARVVLCDVGISNMVLHGFGGSPTLREMLCSPESIAPEQIRGEPSTPATDVYAFGVLLYRLLTGVAPFHADTTTQMLRAHLTRPVPAMRDRCPAIEVPPVLENFVRRCLARRQEDRPHTLDAVLAGLQECEAAVLSMSARGTPSWIAPRSFHHSSPRAQPRTEEDLAPSSPPSTTSLSIEPLPDDAFPCPACAPSTPVLSAPPVLASLVPHTTVPSTPPCTASLAPQAFAPSSVVQSTSSTCSTDSPKDTRVPPEQPDSKACLPVVPAPSHPSAFSKPNTSMGVLTPQPVHVAPLVLAATVATLAAIYALVTRRPHPLPTTVAPPLSRSTLGPAPPPPVPTPIRLEVVTNAPRATLSLRGRSYPLPIELEIEPTHEQERIELAAQGYQTRHLWLLLDRTMHLRLDLDPAPASVVPAPDHARSQPPWRVLSIPRGLPATRTARAPDPLPASTDPTEAWIQAHRAEVSACTLSAHAAGVPRGTRVVLHVTLKPSGRVRSVSIPTTGNTETVARCLESAVRRWAFPPPHTPMERSFTLPFIL